MSATRRVLALGNARGPLMNDPSQTAFYIPYVPQDAEENAHVEAYRTAWDKCSARLKSEIDRLYAPAVAAAIRGITTAYDNVLPGLPYPELPTIAVHNASPLFINTVLDSLPDNVATSSLHPSDISSLTVGMKNLISGFLGDKPTKSRLAAYDISLLEDFFTANDPLLVILHDFEQIDVALMQDILHICSTKLPTLSFVFLLFLSSPPTPSFIHNTYSRNTLRRLRVQPFSTLQLNSNRLIEHLLLKTFFDPAFAPDLVLGPTILESLIDFFLRHHSSIDTLLTTLQIAYLKHFLTEPLSILNNPTAPLTKPETYNPIFSSLSSRLNNAPFSSSLSSKKTLLSHLTQHHSTFFQNYQNFRLGFTLLIEVYTFLIKKGYKPIRLWEVQGLTKPMINAMRGQISREIKIIEMYVSKLRQETFQELVISLNDIYISLPREIQQSQGDAMTFVGDFARKVEMEDDEEFDTGEFAEWLVQQLTNLLQPLDRSPLWDIWYTGSTPFPTELLNPSIRASIINGLLHPYDFTLPIPINQNPTTTNSPTNSDEENADGTLSPTVSEIQARLESTHVVQLTSSPSKHPLDDTHTPDKDMIPTATHQLLPDTSILFDRYMNGAGKLINVYDWYQSFKIVLETQRSEEEVKRRAEIEARQKKKSKSKNKGKTPRGRGSRRGKVKSRGSPVKKGKGKEKEQQQITSSEEEEEEEEKEVSMIDDEAYQQEIQARFIRSLHELDYLGFLKHTGRRKEHVVRTVFDVVDDEVEVEEVGGGGDNEDGFVSGDDDDVDVDVDDVDDGQEDHNDSGEDGLGENGDEEDEE